MYGVVHLNKASSTSNPNQEKPSSKPAHGNNFLAIAFSEIRGIFVNLQITNLDYRNLAKYRQKEKH
jgi:hypothetical protein